MTLEESWRQKNDEDLIAAVAQLKDYTEDAQAVIQAEISRRGISPDSQRPMGKEPERYIQTRTGRLTSDYRFWGGPINSISHATFILRRASNCLYFLSGLVLLSMMKLLFWDVGDFPYLTLLWNLVYVVLVGQCAFLMPDSRSRVAIPIIYFSVISGILKILMGGLGGPMLGWLIDVGIFWSALRGHKATVYLRSLEQTTSTGQEEESSDLH